MLYHREVPQGGIYDVIVAGGGPAGFAAAISAARQGLKTLLLELNGCLGGTATAGALPFYLGSMTGSIPFRQMVEKGLCYRDLPRPRTAVRGIFGETIQRIRSAGGGIGPCVLAQTDRWPGLDRLGCHDEFTFDLETGKRVFDEMAEEAGVHLLFYTQVIDVACDGERVQGVYTCNKDGITFYEAKAFLDCTGDADLVDRAGFLTYKGDRETGEMCAVNLVAHLENIDSAKLEAYLNQGGDPWFGDICKRMQKEHPDLDLPDHLIIFPMVQEGVFMINGGTSFTDYDGTNAESLTALTLRGRKRAKILAERLFRTMIPGGEHCRVRLTASYPGIRETRRIVAEYGLTEEDLLEGRTFPDTIAFAGRHFDLGRKTGQPFHQRNLSVKGGIASIPYRCMIPKGSKNLLAAGRCIHADGQALGPARIMSTCYAVGEAAGQAAYLSLRDNKAFREVNTDELRDRLRKSGAEIDL